MWTELIAEVSKMRDAVVAANLTREIAALEGVLITARDIEDKAKAQVAKK
jgi:hypothetical protein